MKKQPHKPIRDISVKEFLQRIPDEKAAVKYLEQLRWAAGLYCPHCGNTDSKRILTDTSSRPYRCRKCGKYFSVRTGTAMAASKVSLHNWLLAIYLLTVLRKGISFLALAKELGVTQKSAGHLVHCIRTAFEQDYELYSGAKKADETYIGGKGKTDTGIRNGTWAGV